MTPATDVYDVVVVGAGAGGMTAAAVAAAEGLTCCWSRRSGPLGGTTAISGGMVWMPGNPKCGRRPRPDSPADAARYLAGHRAGEATTRRCARPSSSHAAEAIAYLEAHTSVRLQPVPAYPDYYPDLPGATLGGRVLEPVRSTPRAARRRLRPARARRCRSSRCSAA